LKNPREIASIILFHVYSGKSVESQLLLNKNYIKLDERDKAFVHLLVLTALRRNGQIENVISNFVKRKFKKNQILSYIIKIAVTQILYLDIPNYSIVNTTVEISKKYGSEKFVNAILRNIVKHKKKLITQTPITLNIPQWLKNNILRYFDNNTLKLIAEKIVTEPCTDIYVKSKLIKDNDWEKTLGGNFVFENVLRLKKNDKIQNLPYFSDGHWWVQGLSATFPVKIFNEIYSKKIKKQISLLDVGSAPGAKTFQLLDSGYNVSSLEISKRRIVTLKKNSQRTKFKTSIINDDFTSYKHKSKFDSILIDAPCSGSGLIQKKPEILVQKKDLTKLLQKQKLMLRNCSKNLKKNGYIIYSVCSIHSDEGQNQIESFLNDNKNFSIESPFNEIKKFKKKTKSPFFITTPDMIKKGSIDGFFIACLKKKS
jgi:16S rRNA (cytosine967-C5)-methyltransferase